MTLVGWNKAPPYQRRLLWTVLLITVGLAIGAVLAEGFASLTLVIGLVATAEILCATFVHALCRLRAVAIDRTPRIDRRGLARYMEHGFDPELGWIRKPNTAKKDEGAWYHIDSRGSRVNPGHEDLPVGVLSFGDSYTFGRECGDRETWQWYLAEKLRVNVLNFGVGNYGLDQALIRLKREYPLVPAPVVVAGVIPGTIARILSVWKHYNEFGNVLAFKPRFVLDDSRLRLLSNVVDSEEKLLHLSRHLGLINRNDYFFERRFKKECFRFPFLVSCLAHIPRLPGATVKAVQNAGYRWNYGWDWLARTVAHLNPSDGVLQLVTLYNDPEATRLLRALLQDFADYAGQHGFSPILLIMPTKEDLLYIRTHGSFYSAFLKTIEPLLPVVDMTDTILGMGSSTKIFCGTHYLPETNCEVARVLADICRHQFADGLGEALA